MATSPPRPPPSASATTKRVSQETLQRAVKALLKWKDSQTKTQKPQLLPQDDFMYLVLALKKIPPKGRTNAYKIPLRHPLHEPSSELCLIIDDRPNSKLTSDIAKKKIKSENIPIAKVLKLSKLKSDYRPFEAKRKLCDSYDMFLADKRVVPLLPKMLGKQFFKKNKKVPLPVDLTHKNWKEQIERACSSALLYLKTGTCSVVKVGKVSMESGEIVENVAAAIDGIVEVVPKKWTGVRSLHLKFSESLALPLFQSLPDMKLKIEGIKDRKKGVKEEGGGEVEVEVKEESKKDEKLSKKKRLKKGRIHEVWYMDAHVGEDELDTDDDEDDNEAKKSEDSELGGAEVAGIKRKNGDVKKGVRVPGELNGEKRAKKMGKVKKRDSVADNDDNESENDDLGSAEFGVKKKRKGDLMNGQVVSKLNGEKRVKKIGKVKKGDSDADKGDNESENDDLGSAEFGGKKRKKGDSVNGQVVSKLNGEKRVEKMGKVGKGDGGKQKKDGMALKGGEESAGKKGRRKMKLGQN